MLRTMLITGFSGGANSRCLPLLKRWLPPAVFDAKLATAFGLDRLKP